MRSDPLISPLIAHLWANNREQIIADSRLDCHARGLHSVMLLNSPGQTIRLFVATTGHDLWKNTPGNIEAGLSVGFHPHHCNLTLLCVAGAFTNWIVSAQPDFGRWEVGEFEYRSAITHGQGSFKRVGTTMVSTISREVVHPGVCARMDAADVHTVSCEAGKLAAWLVFEGREDPAYSGRCYSSADLENVDLAGMYQPTTETSVQTLLEVSGLL